MRGRADAGVSILLEYLLLTGILSVFVVVVGLYLHDTLTEIQVSRVVENQFADVASQISAIYTDYVLLRPESGYIKTKIQLLPKVGDYEYAVRLFEHQDVVYLKVESRKGDFEAFSSMGLSKFVKKSGEYVDIATQGETVSTKAESEEEKPEIVYESKKRCPFEVKPRLDFDPGSVELGGTTNLTVYFANPSEITRSIAWRVTLWNGSEIYGNSPEYATEIRVTDVSKCDPLGSYDYLCKATIFAWIDDSDYIVDGTPICNGTYNETILVSERPQESNPNLTYSKWVEPQEVSPGQTFEVHLKIEGRGFVNQAVNLSVSQIIDVSGSMDWDTIYRQFNFTVNPHVVERVVNTSQFSPNPGTLEILAYTTDRLPDWYFDLDCGDYYDCDACSDPPPWNGKGYDSSLIKVYVNDVEYGSDYSDGAKIGKRATINGASGTYKIEVVARAPEQINLTIAVRFNGTEILNETLPYKNAQEVNFDLPQPVNFERVLVKDFPPNIPYWYVDRVWWLWWWYRCYYKDNHNDPNVMLNVWIIDPNGNKHFVANVDREWRLGSPDILYEYYEENPPNGEYKIVVVPTTKEPAEFKATVYVRRIDAAKLAAIEFNDKLGEGDFIGLTKFSDDAYRIEVNSSPLKYMTTDKSIVNDEILSLTPGGATDHPDALYYGVQVFPIWDKSGNNCTECINGTRPLMILLTDGEPTICNKNANYFGCQECTESCNGRRWCQCSADQAICIADYIKNNVEINGFSVPICTIGFGTDINDRTQQLLKDIASPRPDNGEPCYFFAQTTEELLNAYRTIFNIFQIAAKNVSVNEVLNVSISGPFKVEDVSVTSNRGSQVSVETKELPDRTIVKLELPSIQKDEVVELVIKLRVKEDAPEGEYDVNIDEESYINFTALNNLGQETGNVTLPITSSRDVVRIKPGGGAEIELR